VVLVRPIGLWIFVTDPGIPRIPGIVGIVVIVVIVEMMTATRPLDFELLLLNYLIQFALMRFLLQTKIN
jgi:hypothetical protein